MILSTEEQSSTRREQNAALRGIRTGRYELPGNRKSMTLGTDAQEALGNRSGKGVGAEAEEVLGNRLFGNFRRGSWVPGNRDSRAPGASPGSIG